MITSVRSVTTSDGVRIGYAVSGSGPVLIAMPDIGFSAALQAEMELADVTAWAEALSERFTYIRYDARGYGFSERNVKDLSLQTWLLDLEAVVVGAGVSQFALLGLMGSTRVALAYAASHAEQVTHLLQWPADHPILGSPEGKHLLGLAEQDWETFTETLAHISTGWQNHDTATALAGFWRQNIPKNVFHQFIEQFRWPSEEEVFEFGSEIRTPVLVLARRHRYSISRMAVLNAIRDLTVVVLPGEQSLPYHGDMTEVIGVLEAFLGEERPGRDVPASPAIKSPRGGSLTRREAEVLSLLATGRSNSEIAGELVISIRTVERHLMRIYDKVGASGKSARVIAAAHAILSAT